MEVLRPVMLLVLLVCFAAELTWAACTGRRVADTKESLSNFSMLLVNALLKSATVAWSLTVLSWFEPFQALRLPETAWAFLVTLLVADFAYYWYHRISHEIPVLWVMHNTHHSSPWMNLSTAVRLNWVAKFVIPFFFAPLVLLGLSPTFLAVSLFLILFPQFFLHTQAVSKLGWLEGRLFNTPSAHRVHHGSNPQYLDKNYAGLLIIWDRIFGTYAREEEPVRYGVTTGFMGHNPLVIQFRPMLQYLRGTWRREKDIGLPPRGRVPC